MPSARLLNSSANAPLFAQLKGSKKVLLLRCTLFVLIATVGVLYKFSFTAVDAFGSIAVQARGEGNPYTEMARSDIIRLQNTDIYTDASLPSEILSANLIDFMTASNGTVTSTSDASHAFKVTGERTDVIIGPKANDTHLSHIVSGTIETCDALLYLRTIVYPYEPFEAENTTAFKDFPDLTSAPLNNGVRLQVPNRNLSDFNYNSGTFADITAMSNGSLQVWVTDSSAFTQSLNPGYRYRVTLSMRYCYGYITWTKLPSALYNLNPPTDIQCTDHPFGSLPEWNQSSYGAYAQGLLKTTLMGQFNGYGVGPGWLSSLPLLTIIQPHFLVAREFNPSLPRNVKCDTYPPGTFALASGIIRQSRTGTTAIGLAVQATVILTSIACLAVLGWPALPLLTEWPAQWLYLSAGGSASRGLEREVVKEATKGTGSGQGKARGDRMLFLSAPGSGDGERGSWGL